MDAKGSTEDPALAKAEKEARELEEQLLLKPWVNCHASHIRGLFGEAPGRGGCLAEDTDRAPSAEEVAAGEVREAIPPAAELRCSAAGPPPRVPTPPATRRARPSSDRGAAPVSLPEGLDKGEDR